MDAKALVVVLKISYFSTVYALQKRSFQSASLLGRVFVENHFALYFIAVLSNLFRMTNHLALKILILALFLFLPVGNSIFVVGKQLHNMCRKIFCLKKIHSVNATEHRMEITALEGVTWFSIVFISLPYT